MKAIYLDHNVVHYHSVAFPKSWDAEAELRAVEDILAKDARFVISLSNLAEAGEGAADVPRYIGFLEGINPMVLSERVAVQRLEIEIYLLSVQPGEKDRRDAREWALNSTFSQALSTIEGMNSEAIIGYSMANLIRYLASHPNDRERINASKAFVPKAIRSNSEARASDPSALSRPEQLRFWLKGLVPTRDRDGRHISSTRQAELLELCIRDFPKLISMCPSLAVEHFLTEFRASNPQRTPELADAVDFQNLVASLAYCDVFVSNDGYAQESAHYCQRKCPHSLARPVRRISEAVALLDVGSCTT